MSASDATDAPPQTEPALRAIAMPADANPAGDIFGGWLLSQMDLAGSTVATRRAKGRVVTVAITAMTFHRPVFVGDEVSCYAEITKIGRTSITVKVESWARRGRSEERIEVTEGIFTYVAVDAERQPCPVPEVGRKQALSGGSGCSASTSSVRRETGVALRASGHSFTFRDRQGGPPWFAQNGFTRWERLPF
jgi:acyl-CoA thioesterase YciA